MKKRRKIEGVQMCQHQYCHPNNLTIPGKRTDVTRIILRHGRGSTPWSLGTLAWHSRLLARLLFYSSFKFLSCLSLCSLCPTGPELSVMSHSLCAFPMPVPWFPRSLWPRLLLPHLADPKPTHRSGSGSKIICLSDFYYVNPHLAGISPSSEQPGRFVLFCFVFLFLIMFGLMSSLTSCPIRAGTMPHFLPPMSSWRFLGTHSVMSLVLCENGAVSGSYAEQNPKLNFPFPKTWGRSDVCGL